MSALPHPPNNPPADVASVINRQVFTPAARALQPLRLGAAGLGLLVAVGHRFRLSAWICSQVLRGLAVLACPAIVPPIMLAPTAQPTKQSQ
jgi:hypothetical protein